MRINGYICLKILAIAWSSTAPVAYVHAEEPVSAISIVTKAEKLLASGKFQETITLLESRVSTPNASPELLYLYGSALELAVIALPENNTMTDFDLFKGSPLKKTGALLKSVEAFEGVVASSEKSLPTNDESSNGLFKRFSGDPVRYCSPSDESYSPIVNDLLAHAEFMNYGPLGKLGAPRDEVMLKRIAVARLTTLAQYLNEAERKRLGQSLTKKGVKMAHLKLQLNFSNLRVNDFWQGYLKAHPADEDMFVLATITSLPPNRYPAKDVVTTYNRLIDKYPILAAQVTGWADRRRMGYGVHMLRKRTFPDELRVRVYRGNSAVGALPYFVTKRTDQGDEVIQKGKIGNDGSFTIGKHFLSSDSHLTVDGISIGTIKDLNGIAYRMYIPELAGTEAANVTMINLKTGRELKLSELKGKVVYIDCWATWCGPCQAPLEHLNKVAGEMEEEWRDKVAVIAISVDKTRAKPTAHVTRKGWNNVQHYWLGEEEERFRKEYRLRGIPRAWLIDQAGRIVLTDHPGDIDLKREVAALLRE